MTPPPCARCGKGLGNRPAFEFRMHGARVSTCLRCAIRDAPTLRRSGLIALVVGTVLTLINQGDLLLQGRWTGALIWKIPLTYVVPFVVATVGALGKSRVERGN